MRVLLQTWDYPPAKGGIQIWMVELARRLPDARVIVIAPSASGDAAFDAETGVAVRRLERGPGGQAAWLARLTVASAAACLGRRVDVIVCGHVVTAPAALIVHRLFGVPYVVLTHAWEIRRRRRRRLVGRLLRAATLVTANSRFTEESVLRYGVSRERVKLLHPGTDPGRFTPGGADRTAPGKTARILTVSRLDELYKGHDTLIRSLPLIKAKWPRVEYAIVGDGRLRSYLARLAASVGVERDVIFLGNVSDEELPSLYQGADVVVQMSREARSGGGAEGFGIVCLEAAAAGRPVVAGRSGGLPDAVVDGVTGLLVDPEDHGQVAEAVLSVLANPPFAERLGRAGRDRVLREFTWDHMARRARNLLAEAAGRQAN